MRPTPGSPTRKAIASSRSASASQSSVGSPSASGSSRSTCWIRGAFVGARPPGLIASSTTSTGASRTSTQVGSLRAAARRRRRGCGRWCSGRGSSARARRSGDRAGCRRVGRRSRAAGLGSRAPAPGADAATRCVASVVRAVTQTRIFSGDAAVEQAVVHVDGVRTFYPPASAAMARRPSYVHGNPTHSEDWVPFLERIGRPGARARPARLGVLRAPEPELRLLDARARRFFAPSSSDSGGRVRARGSRLGLVRPDRGAAPSRAAPPARADLNAVPLLPGYRWHWVARYLWRRAGIGELANLTADRSRVAAAPAPGDRPPGPASRGAHRDRDRGEPPGTWPRCSSSTAPPTPTASRPRAAARALGCPALVVWGRATPTSRRASAAPTPSGCRMRSWSSSTMPATGRGIERPDAVERSPAFSARPTPGSISRPLQWARDARAPGPNRLAVPQRLARCRAPVPALLRRLQRRPARPRPHDSSTPAAYMNAYHVMDVEKSLGGVLRAGAAADAHRPRLVADRLRELRLPELPLHHHDGVHRLALSVPERALLLRPQHVHDRDGLALVGYAVFPTAPRGCSSPRGSRTRSRRLPASARTRRPRACCSNKYAAVPSMHIAFSLMVAVPAAALSKRAITRTLWSAYPLLVFFVIIVTANHHHLALPTLRPANRPRRPGLSGCVFAISVFVFERQFGWGRDSIGDGDGGQVGAHRDLAAPGALPAIGRAAD